MTSLAVAFRTSIAEYQAIAMPTLENTYHAPHAYMRLNGWKEWARITPPNHLRRAAPQSAQGLTHYLRALSKHCEGEANTTPNTTP